MEVLDLFFNSLNPTIRMLNKESNTCGFNLVEEIQLVEIHERMTKMTYVTNWLDQRKMI